MYPLKRSKLKKLQKLQAITEIILLIRRRVQMNTQVQTFTRLKQFYFEFKYKLTNFNREAKTPYYRNEMLKSKKNNNRYWKLVNKASNRTKQKHIIPHIKKQNGFSLNLNKVTNKIHNIYHN